MRTSHFCWGKELFYLGRIARMGENKHYLSWADRDMNWTPTVSKWPFALPKDVEDLVRLWGRSSIDMGLDEFLTKSTGVAISERLPLFPAGSQGLFGPES
jgi:hypothetical protein